MSNAGAIAQEVTRKHVHHHFSRIAHKYRDVRTTDKEPILFIKEKLEDLAEIAAVDVGCGTGRYDMELARTLGDRLSLTCVDANPGMLRQLNLNKRKYKMENLNGVRASAESLPFFDSSLECVFSFNAMHHFNFPGFLKESSRVLKDDGSLFVYTRLRSQNKRNIWGSHFPKFPEKETRLYELDELQELLQDVPQLGLESIEYYKYRRLAKLEWLREQAINHHYSTFFMYEDGEFDEALENFVDNIYANFEDTNRIEWDDENIMLVLRKQY